MFGISCLTVFGNTDPDFEDGSPSSDGASANQDSPPVNPQARQFVLERLVPTKRLTSVPLLRAAMRVPREWFVPKDLTDSAYAEIPLPLGSGQTLFPPFDTIYALENLNLRPNDRVWIVGTGVGYAAAIASQLVSEVDAVEFIPSLLKKSNDAFKKLGLKNIRIKSSTPDQVLKESLNFDKILVTLFFTEAPPEALSNRLKENGEMIVPLGAQHEQRLALIKKISGTTEIFPLIEICPARAFNNTPTPEIRQESVSLLEESFEPAVNLFPASEQSMPGWFDRRNVNILPEDSAPEGKSVLCFDSNSVRMEQKRKDALKRREIAESQSPDTDQPDLELSPLTIRQREEERTTRAVRNFPLNGKKIRRINISCYIEGIGIHPDSSSRARVLVAWLTLFDDNRAPLREIPLFSLKKGDTPWKKIEIKSLLLPKRTKEAEIGLGIIGGYGILKIDALKIEKAEASEKKD